MATLDEILSGTSTASGGTTPATGTQERAEQNQGATGGTPAKENKGEAQPITSPTTAVDKPQAVVKDKQPDIKTPKVGSYEDMLRLWGNKPKTPQELAEEAKKYKRAQIFNAISDGVSALANLFATTQYAPNMYDGKKTLTGQAKVSYDKMLQDDKDNRFNYYNLKVNAKRADDAEAEKDRNWRRQLQLDQEARDRYKAEFDYRQKRDKEQDEYRKERDMKQDNQWTDTFNENKRRAKEDEKLRLTRAVLSANAKAARGVRGEERVFSGGDGIQVKIYENVWKGSMQQVFEDLIADRIGKDEKMSDAMYDRRMSNMTTKEKEDFVIQNWTKSEKAKQTMKILSTIDPATMISSIDGGDETGDDGSLAWGAEEETDW